MLAIYRREFKSHFTNMTGYIFISILLLFTGIYVTAINLNGGYSNFEYALSNLGMVYILAIPVLTMRSFAEEKRTRTDQLLYSLPITLSSVVIGKYLAMISVLLMPMLVMLAYPIILSAFGIVYYVSAYSSLLGFFLLGAALIAICMFVSTLTDSQVIAAVIGFAVVLVLYLMNGLSSLLPTSAISSYLMFIVVEATVSGIAYFLTKSWIVTAITAGVLVVPTSLLYFAFTSSFEGLFPSLVTYLAVFDRFDIFTYGIFDVTAIIYYISIIAFSLYLCIQALEKRRWS